MPRSIDSSEIENRMMCNTSEENQLAKTPPSKCPYCGSNNFIDVGCSDYVRCTTCGRNIRVTYN